MKSGIPDRWPLCRSNIAALLFAAFVCAVGAGGEVEEPDRARIASFRAEDLIPPTAIGFVAVRDVPKTIDKARSLGVARIIEALDLGRLVGGPIKKARARLEAGLAVVGLTPEAVVETFRGSAFVAVLGFPAGPPMVPELLIWIETKDMKPRAVSTFLSFLKGIAAGQGEIVEEYEYRGATVSAIELPMLPVPICWSLTAGGVAFSLGRRPVEGFLARAAERAAPRPTVVGGEDGADLEEPALGRFSELPVVGELLSRLGEGEDLVAFFNFPALLERMGARIPQKDRRGFRALGLDSVLLAYGLRIAVPEPQVSPGGVKEVVVAWSPEKRGALRLLDLPALGEVRLEDVGGAILGLEAAFDAQLLFTGIRDIARETEGEDAAGEITGTVKAMADALGLPPEEMLRALSGRLQATVTSRPEGFIPDGGLVFEPRDAETAAPLFEGIRRALSREEEEGRFRLESREFEGLTLVSLVFEDEDVPTVISPAGALCGDKVLAAVSTQAMKRLIRRTAGAVALPPGPALEEKRPAALFRGPLQQERGGLSRAMAELSPGPSFVLALDLSRAGAIALDIMSLVPRNFGRRFRRVFDRLPPVEDLLRELCGAAVALYSLPEGAAVESYSPTGQLPLWLGVAAIAARARGRERPGPTVRPPAPVEPDPWEDEPLF